MTRDLTQAQFLKACARHGFKPEWFGFYSLGPGTTAHVHAPNAGSPRRAQLAYLLREREKDLCKERAWVGLRRN